MLKAVLVLSTICGLVKSSGILHANLAAPVPVVTAASSQYFERTFNRLVAAPPVVQPVIPVAADQPVFVNTAPKTVPVATPSNTAPIEPNVAIAIATAHAAAPVATILLPPYPFGPPPIINIIPQTPPINVPEGESKTEPTTAATTAVDLKTTLRESEPTTPLPSNTDNSFAQALPSDQEFKFKQYFAPPLPPVQRPPPLPPVQRLPALPPVQRSPPLPPVYTSPFPQGKPQKVKTAVEIVPVPLAYIAPPPPQRLQQYPTKQIHTYIPRPAKIIVVREIYQPAAPLKIYRMPSRLVIRPRFFPGNLEVRPIQNPIRKSFNTRDVEETTFRPFNGPSTKPPKI